jgi:hypothetical protein
LEAAVDRYFSGPPRGKGTVLQPEREEEIGTSLLDRFKAESYGKGGCFDARVGPGMLIKAALQLIIDAAIFSDPHYLGGGDPAEFEVGGEPQLAGSLVGALVRLWHAIPITRILLRSWGNTIANLRDCREFEWRERYWPSACHFAQFLAESDLAEAWRAMLTTCALSGPPFAEEDFAFGEDGPMPPFHVDRWYAALPALRRHFTKRGDVWGIADVHSKVEASIAQEATRLKMVLTGGGGRRQQNEAPAPAKESAPAAAPIEEVAPLSAHSVARKQLDVRRILELIEAEAPRLPEPFLGAYVLCRGLAELSGAVAESLRCPGAGATAVFRALVVLRGLTRDYSIGEVSPALTAARGAPLWSGAEAPLGSVNAHCAAFGLAGLLLGEIDYRFEQLGARRGENGKPVWVRRLFRDNFAAICRSFRDVRFPDWYTICVEIEFETVKAAALSDSPPPAAAQPGQYVTLDNLAAIVSRSKRTLEKRKVRERNPLPPPDVEGGGGRPDEWLWPTIRPWLEQEFGRKLPERFPGDRFAEGRPD